MPAVGRPRTFLLRRDVDVAWGVEWPDGSCALRWATDVVSSATYASISDVESDHGATTIVWDAEVPLPVPLPRILLTLNCGCSTDVSLDQAGRGFRFEIGTQWDCPKHGKTRVIDARWGE